MAREALRFLPLLKACRADSAGVESVPCVSADAGPQVVLARRPAAERAPDARPGGIKVLVVLQFRLKNRGGRAIAVGHVGYYVRKAFLGQTSSKNRTAGEAGRGVDKGNESPSAMLPLTALVRKSLSRLLLSSNLCYKPEHA